MNTFKYSNDNKRYHTYNYYLKNKYHQKVAKIPLDAHFTCPNRDGTCGYGGCVFCGSEGSYNESTDYDLIKQYENNKKVILNKWPSSLFIPYFQAYTNTYGSLEKIKEMTELFINQKDVVGIDYATRCDCLEQEKIDYLESLTNQKEIWVELGLQTIHDKTAKMLNRGHTYEAFVETVNRLSKTNIKVCVHIINGLPNETKEMMLETVKALNLLPIDAIKIHMLFVTKNSALGNQYLTSPFPLLTKEEYIDITVNQLRLLRPEIIIQRLTGDPIKEDLIAPEWVLNKVSVLNDIDKIMVKDNIYQGDLIKA